MELFTPQNKVIDYIRERGHCSYSSLKLLRDGGVPGYFSAPHFDHGTELHSRWMEKKVLTKFDKEVEEMLRGMKQSLNNDKVAMMLLKDAAVEVEFNEPINGVMTHGYIDILPPKLFIGDLKTTKHTTRKAFIESMDFLQPALYLKAMRRKDFYYIGVSKVEPYPVFTFRVSDYPKKLKESQIDLVRLLKDVKQSL